MQENLLVSLLQQLCKLLERIITLLEFIAGELKKPQ